MQISLMLDILVAVLLVVTIGYAVVLNKRLSSLRKDKDELARLAQGFVETTAKAEVGIGELRSMTEILQERIGRAESLRDDLVFLMERGNSTADRLEGVVRDARDQTGAPSASAVTKPSAPAVTKPSAPKPSSRPSPESMADETSKTREPLTADPAERPAPDDVSEAERELLKALRTAG
ncbi:MAG: hypothetical protein HOH04_17480 [Rhodospirillaceae bacterium]|jgi:hypothetical protein|nr:hypothetical protein [Rhodospirillaceae bacterium]